MRTAHTPRLIVVTTAVVAAVAAAGYFIVQPSHGAPSPRADVDQSAVAKSDAWAQRPTVTVGPNDTGVRYSGADAQRIGGDIGSSIPLPPGGTFDDIHWQYAVDTTPTEIQAKLEYNASCDWYRYVQRTGSPGPRTLAVLSQIANWPSFREDFTGDTARKIASAAARGDLGPLNDQVAVNCH